MKKLGALLVSMWRIGVGLIPVVVALLFQWLCIEFESLQLYLAFATLPLALGFILIYVPEKPWRTWFGSSLLLLAVAVLLYTLSVVLYRMLGPDYAGRAQMVTASVSLTFVAMLMRLCVLSVEQWRERRTGVARYTRRRGSDIP